MSEIFTGFINNYIIQVAALSWLTAQVLKTIINFVFTKKFKAERLIGAGGMPSSHTALVVSTAVATAKECGTSSPIFALAALFAAVVMYDAMGVRYAAGEQAKVINQLVDEWLDTVKFDQVLAVSNDKLVVGNPTVAGATVEASVVGEGKGKKVIVYKYKRKSGYHKKQGHRQAYTQVKIDKINA